MYKIEKVLVTGSNGLTGSALRRIYGLYPEYEFNFCSRNDYDLIKEQDIISMYERFRPDYVIHTAARVGGIGLNLEKPGELFFQNIIMNSFMIHYAYIYSVKRILCFSSVCSFPDNVPLLKEELQQFGEPYKDNFAYGYAKRMVDIQIKAYYKQYGVNYCSVILTNLYGQNDNFDLRDGHVIPALIHKCYLAKKNKEPLTVWGDGSSLREFICSDDVAHISIALLKTFCDRVLVSNPVEISIKDICKIICDKMSFKGNTVFDSSKPNGQYRRPSDISLLKSIVPNFKFTDYATGVENTVHWFISNYPNIRGIL